MSENSRPALGPAQEQTPPDEVLTLAGVTDGQWLVTTRGSQHRFDLSAWPQVFYLRTPGAGGPTSRRMASLCG